MTNEILRRNLEKKHASGLISALLCIHQLLSSEYSKYVLMQALYQFLFCFDAV
jgi:hypothetical protein